MIFVPNCDTLSEKRKTDFEIENNVKFVMDTDLRLPNGLWSCCPYALFYSANSDKYIALYCAIRTGKWYQIEDTDSALEEFRAVLIPDGRVIYSTYRNYVNNPQGSPVSVTGGRDYLRLDGNKEACKEVTCKIVNGNVEVIV